MERSRRRYGLAAALLAVVFALGVSGWALAAQTEAEFDASFAPEKLSRSEQTPTSLHVAMRLKTPEVTRLSPLREFEISEDRHANLHLKDVPVCPRGDVESPPPQQRCKDAVIGSGTMKVNIHFVQSIPIDALSELTIYNRGLHEGVRTLSIIGYLEIPTPAAVVATVLVKRSKLGRYKLKLVGSIPKIAGGAGSITFLGLRFRKGVFSARCVKGHLDTGFRVTLEDGTFFSGVTPRPCVPSP